MYPVAFLKPLPQYTSSFWFCSFHLKFSPAYRAGTWLGLLSTPFLVSISTSLTDAEMQLQGMVVLFCSLRYFSKGHISQHIFCFNNPLYLSCLFPKLSSLFFKSFPTTAHLFSRLGEDCTNNLDGNLKPKCNPIRDTELFQLDI